MIRTCDLCLRRAGERLATGGAGWRSLALRAPLRPLTARTSAVPARRFFWLMDIFRTLRCLIRKRPDGRQLRQRRAEDELPYEDELPRRTGMLRPLPPPGITSPSRQAAPTCASRKLPVKSMFSPCDKPLLVGWADAHLVDSKRMISGVSVEAHLFHPKPHACRRCVC